MLEVVLNAKLEHRARAFLQLEWWPKESGALPEPGRVVLAELAGDRGYDLWVRRRVGSLCGNDHPNAAEISFYEHMFRTSYGAGWPSALLRWAYLEAKV